MGSARRQRGERGPYYAPHCGWADKSRSLWYAHTHTRNIETRKKHAGPFFGFELKTLSDAQKKGCILGNFVNTYKKLIQGKALTRDFYFKLWPRFVFADGKKCKTDLSISLLTYFYPSLKNLVIRAWKFIIFVCKQVSLPIR